MSNFVSDAFQPGTPNLVAGESAADEPPASVALTTLASEVGASASLRLTEYRGARTVAAFSQPAQEFAGLLTSAGVYDLGWRGFLRCAGEDRARWLNGMVTNSVAGLAAEEGCYAFVLNAQGRIQGDLCIYQRADALWLQTDRAQVETLMAFLDHYIIMDDVTLEHAQHWTAIGVAGPDAAQTLATAGFSFHGLATMHLAETSWRGRPVAVLAAYAPLVSRYEIWCAPEDALNIWNALVDAGAARCGAEAVEQLRILEGTPAYSVDITSRDLPQETSQMRALHFSKGCYLGQEIVERIRSRGNVHRTLSGFVLDSSFVLPEPGARVSLLAEGKPMGELSSIARVVMPGSAERVLALGSIRREALERKATLTAEGSPVTPSSLPFDFARSTVQP